MQNFDPSEWQGRNEEQVESNYKLAAATVGLIVFLMLAAGVYFIIKQLC